MQRLDNLFERRLKTRLQSDISRERNRQLIHLNILLFQKLNKLMRQRLQINPLLLLLCTEMLTNDGIYLLNDIFFVFIHTKGLILIYMPTVYFLLLNIYQQFSILYQLLTINQSQQSETNMVIQILLGFFLLLVALYSWVSYKARINKTSKPQICVILGSGGHTTEMCEVLRNFQFQNCSKANIVIGSSDNLSASFFLSYFKELKKGKCPNFDIFKTNRTNAVKQSKVTSIFTTLVSLLQSLLLIINSLTGTTHLISNGPGICVPFFFIFWALNKLKITKTKLIFIESWCRVETISLSGKIVRFFADQFLVHWESQENLIRQAKYKGKII